MTNRPGQLLKDVLARDPNQVYQGLLTVLLRLVFILFAEDRGLLSTDPIYTNHYGIGGLFERLRADAARYPDTMDQRFGAWAQLLTLFHLIYDGGSHGPKFDLPARRGYLFDPSRYPFLEGRRSAEDSDRHSPRLGRRAPSRPREPAHPRRRTPQLPQPRCRTDRQRLRSRHGLHPGGRRRTRDCHHLAEESQGWRARHHQPGRTASRRARQASRVAAEIDRPEASPKSGSSAKIRRVPPRPPRRPRPQDREGPDARRGPRRLDDLPAVARTPPQRLPLYAAVADPARSSKRPSLPCSSNSVPNPQPNKSSA